MKTKWLWVVLPAVLAIMVTALWRSSGGTGRISARLVSRRLDPFDHVQIVYEITNGTSSAIGMNISGLQERQQWTGWWDARDRWTTSWHLDKTAGITQSPRQATLRARSAAQLEI